MNDVELTDHDALRSAFEEQGIAFPVQVLFSNEVRYYRTGFEDLETRLGGKTQNLSCTHLHFKWARELATHARVLDAVEPLLGPDLLVLSTLILSKHPRDPAFVGWHQDGTYWKMHEAPTASAWIALTDSKPANGCMRVIYGSHLEKMMPHVCTYAANSLLGHGEQVDAEVDESRATDVVLRAGEMSIHQNSILHGSRPNGSDEKRIGFIVRFVTPAFQHARAHVLHARGRLQVATHMQFWDADPPQNIERGIAERAKYLTLLNSFNQQPDERPTAAEEERNPQEGESISSTRQPELGSAASEAARAGKGGESD